MWSFLVTPEFQPFTIAALVLIGVLAIEIASGLLGASVSTLLDTVFGLHGVHVEAALHHGPDASGPESSGSGPVFAAHHGMPHGMTGPFGTAFDWLNAGRVPLLVLMMAATACFAVFGMVLQIVAMHLAAPLPPAIAAVIAIAAAVPGTRWTSRLVTSILPRDETYAVTNEDLIGRVGIVTLGPVVAGAAARAKVQDKYGNWHFPRIAAGAADVSIPEGASVLIVDRVGGEYTVIEAEGRLVSSKEQPR
jgi:membrane protein implicated in regulation of membrane protease activity